MSPEQAKGVDADPTQRHLFVWVRLHELLSGRRAFEGETTSDTLANILKSEVDFSRLPASLPPLLREILTRCLEKIRSNDGMPPPTCASMESLTATVPRPRARRWSDVLEPVAGCGNGGPCGDAHGRICRVVAEAAPAAG